MTDLVQRCCRQVPPVVLDMFEVDGGDGGRPSQTVQPLPQCPHQRGPGLLQRPLSPPGQRQPGLELGEILGPGDTKKYFSSLDIADYCTLQYLNQAKLNIAIKVFQKRSILKIEHSRLIPHD